MLKNCMNTSFLFSTAKDSRNCVSQQFPRTLPTIRIDDSKLLPKVCQNLLLNKALSLLDTSIQKTKTPGNYLEANNFAAILETELLSNFHWFSTLKWKPVLFFSPTSTSSCSSAALSPWASNAGLPTTLKCRRGVPDHAVTQFVASAIPCQAFGSQDWTKQLIFQWLRSVKDIYWVPGKML